ncbi:MAG TPA: type II secretion system F family protein [Acidimicrobiales bacterium]|nr:type II secretion system F family protein [Acidimicrobiales bacterium]
MIPAAVLGALVGIGVVLVWVGLHPRAEPLAAVLGRLGQPRPARLRDDTGPRWVERVGRTRPARAYTDALAADLRVMGRSSDDEVVSLAIDIVAGLAAPVAAAAVLALVGIWLPPLVVLLAAVVLAGLLGLNRWATVESTAKARRSELRYALAAFCDLTAMHLAAGRGVSQALETAAAHGDGWAFTEFRAALAAARERGITGAEGLERLGNDVDVDDVIEVAGAIHLAGQNGAAVRTTLASKAQAIRDRLTADVERKAATATEQMGLPAAAVLMALVAFYCYPAVMSLLHPPH